MIENMRRKYGKRFPRRDFRNISVWHRERKLRNRLEPCVKYYEMFDEDYGYLWCDEKPCFNNYRIIFRKHNQAYVGWDIDAYRFRIENMKERYETPKIKGSWRWRLFNGG